MLANASKVLALSFVVGVMTSEVPDHDPKEGVEAAANDTRYCRENEQTNLADSCCLLDLDKLLEESQDKEIREEGNDQVHDVLGFGDANLRHSETSINDVSRIVASGGIQGIVFDNVVPSFPAVHCDYAPSTEY